MAKYAILQTFYASDKWGKFRQLIINQRGMKCEYCGGIVKKPKELTLHHCNIELTPENVHDANISLNPDNVQIVHHECHNKIHKRWGKKTDKNVYLVFGPPLAGKMDYVREHMQRGDIVINIDRLYSAVSMLPEYDKPDNLFSNVIGIQNVLIDNIKTRHGKWCNAWIVGGYADKYKRERVANETGAEIIYCEIDKEECLNKLKVDEDRQYRIKEWTCYIEKWFEQYS
jgi:hypothetical protein